MTSEVYPVQNFPLVSLSLEDVFTFPRNLTAAATASPGFMFRLLESLIDRSMANADRMVVL